MQYNTFEEVRDFILNTEGDRPVKIEAVGRVAIDGHWKIHILDKVFNCKIGIGNRIVEYIDFLRANNEDIYIVDKNGVEV